MTQGTKNSVLYLEKSKKKLADSEGAEEEETYDAPSRDVSRERGRQGKDSDIQHEDNTELPTRPVAPEPSTRKPSSGGDPPGEKRGQSPLKKYPSPLKDRIQKAKYSSPLKQRSMSDEELLRKDPPVMNYPSDLSTHNSDEQDEADRLKGEGNKAMARKEYEKAVRYYSKSLRLAPAGPNSHVYFSNRAAALCYLERYEEAELDAERSLALNPEYGKAHARLGLSRYFLRDYYGAVEAYESALEYDPNNAASRSYLAKAKSKISRRHSGSSAVYVE